MTSPGDKRESLAASPQPVRSGADRVEAYLPILQGKRVGLVVNHSSRVGDRHLIDTLLALGIQVEILFGPEHGLRGDAPDGKVVADSRDDRTGLPVISLYGKQKKPTPPNLLGLDILVFDIQDVGARFYTYISTLHYVMEACAESALPFLVLDRPNPNGHYVDGPVLDTSYRSFVGMHPVPVVYGMTIGEYARMINGEGWLTGGRSCNLTVIPCTGYDHSIAYEPRVPPSPNLPSQRAIYLYPSLCFFEGTVISVGRGTDSPFEWFGHPGLPGPVLFTPAPNAGSSHPPFQGKPCRGTDLRQLPTDSLRRRGQLELTYLVDTYRSFPDPGAFFLDNNFFDKLSGGPMLRQQIKAGWDVEMIRKSWADDLRAFREIRKKYLLYPD